MKTRHVVLTVLGLCMIGLSALAYLGTERRLPPPLARAYERIASTVAPSEPPMGGGDAGPASVRRTTQAAPLSSAQLGAPLVHGKFVSECGAPDNMKVLVKVTVRMGRPVDVAVTTDPPNGAVASCVERATREMQWDVSPKTQHVTVTY